MMEVLYKVEVSVRTEYLENQSLPSEGKYCHYNSNNYNNLDAVSRF